MALASLDNLDREEAGEDREAVLLVCAPYYVWHECLHLVSGCFICIWHLVM